MGSSCVRSSSLFIFAIILFGINDDRRAINAQRVNDTVWKGFSVSCGGDDEPVASCHGVRLVRKIVQRLLEEVRRKRDLEIVEGVSLVRSDEDTNNSSSSGGANERNGRFLKNFGAGMGSIVRMLENKELRIGLPSLLPTNLEKAIEESLPASTDEDLSKLQARGGGGGGGGGFGGGGGKKGDGGIMLMAMMMGKMMMAMGMGALGLLAMKALMISALALMLSLIIAAKKLASKEDDGGHHIVYAQEVGGHHHRRRRDVEEMSADELKNHPYRAYGFSSAGIASSFQW